MPRLTIPNSVALQNVGAFFRKNAPFRKTGNDAILEFDSRWIHLEPVALVMAAAWGAWARRNGYTIRVINLGRKTAYAGRMRLFEILGVDYDPGLKEHEEAGRFMPLVQVKNANDIRRVIGDISALLHLGDDTETLAAVQYCVSELLRNVLEHSKSEDGAFICAHRFTSKPSRVTIAVADCGQGIRKHLARAYPDAASSDTTALKLAMTPGVTGAQAGLYGTPDNAGAGLFITRCIAKGSGGYFFLASGKSAYRQRRSRSTDEMISLNVDPFAGTRFDLYEAKNGWEGTVVSVEIRTETIADYQGFFRWIFERVPRKTSHRNRIRFS